MVSLPESQLFPSFRCCALFESRFLFRFRIRFVVGEQITPQVLERDEESDHGS